MDNYPVHRDKGRMVMVHGYGYMVMVYGYMVMVWLCYIVMVIYGYGYHKVMDNYPVDRGRGLCGQLSYG